MTIKGFGKMSLTARKTYVAAQVQFWRSVQRDLILQDVVTTPQESAAIEARLDARIELDYHDYTDKP